LSDTCRTACRRNTASAGVRQPFTKADVKREKSALPISLSGVREDVGFVSDVTFVTFLLRCPQPLQKVLVKRSRKAVSAKD
jgi:hypothetical protein